jgi:hypothetical protein
VVLESPYDPGFVAELKDRVPYGSREWDGQRKRWLLSPLYLDELHTLCKQFSLSVIDERPAAQTAALLAQDNPYASMPDDLRTAFATLTLAPAAPLCVAEAAYRALAKVFHPDNQATGDHEIAERLTDAIATIRSYLAPPDDDIPF